MKPVNDDNCGIIPFKRDFTSETPRTLLKEMQMQVDAGEIDELVVVGVKHNEDGSVTYSRAKSAMRWPDAIAALWWALHRTTEG